MNWILMVASLALVVGFGSSAALAGAYGLAVSGAMTIVTPLDLESDQIADGQGEPCAARRSVAAVHCRHRVPARQSDQARGRRLAAAGPGLIIFWLMQTWQSGRASVMARLLREQKPVRDFLEDLKRDPPVRVAGTSIFLDQPRRRAFRAHCSTTSSSTESCTSGWCCLTVVTREQPRVLRPSA
jgi:KUP system potassium uptake protein